MAEGPVGTEPGCTHPQCRRRHPHAGPAILNREDAAIADRAEAAADAAQPDIEQPAGPMSASELRRRAVEALARGAFLEAEAYAQTAIALDVAGLRRDLASPRYTPGR